MNTTFATLSDTPEDNMTNAQQISAIKAAVNKRAEITDLATLDKFKVEVLKERSHYE